MIKNNYYSHYTLEGFDPLDRAHKHNFTYVVREVIENGKTIDGVYLNLKKNAANFNIVLRQQHTRAGIGIGKNPQGVMIVTMVLSTRDFELYPYQPQEVDKIREYVSKYIRLRDKFAKKEDPVLTKLIQEWLNDHRDIDGVDYLFINKYFKTGKIKVLPTYVSVFPPTPSLADSIHTTDISYFIKNRKELTNLGVGIGTVSDGKV